MTAASPGIPRNCRTPNGIGADRGHIRGCRSGVIASCAAVIIMLSSCAHGDRTPCVTSNILSVPGAVRVRLFDAVTGLAMPGLNVTLHSDNEVIGVTCIKAPCPTNSRTLALRADDQGFMLIPDGFLQIDSHLDSESRFANVIEDAVCTDDTGWILELLPTGKDIPRPPGPPPNLRGPRAESYP